MEIPKKCPICNGILLNSWKKSVKDNLKERLLLICRQITHEISFVSNIKQNEIDAIVLLIDYKNQIYLTWHLDKEELCLSKLQDKMSSKSMPFFKPNFSNFSALLNKIKTYIIFL